MTHLAFSPDGRSLVTAAGGAGRQPNTNEFPVLIWDTSTGRLTNTLRGQTGGTRCLAFWPDSQRVIASDGSELRIWDVTNGQQVATIQANARIRSVAFSPDRKTLAIGDVTQRIKLLHSAEVKDVLASAKERNIRKLP